MAQPKAAKVAKIKAVLQAVVLIEKHDWHRRSTAEGVANLGSGLGFTITLAAHTNTIRYRGIAATCAWSPDHGLISAWRRAALRWLKANA